MEKPIKSKNYLGSIDQDYESLKMILDECKTVSTFIFEGMLCLGDQIGTVKCYLKENPSKSFYVWLIDNEIVIDRSWSLRQSKTEIQ